MSAAPDIAAIADAYLEAVGGDAAAALNLALSDLIDATVEVDLRARALDQWVSRGYVQGRATERLHRIRQEDADRFLNQQRALSDGPVPVRASQASAHGS
ncbi:hypothetical protein [Microvirga flavescens]|uniref:hypothetical protein n=1 Tax=Microvirga flavescens TaxID=2249811 RepID=UPI000DDBCF66|nr:hypothetical protein [Microvirga flavescens]